MAIRILVESDNSKTPRRIHYKYDIPGVAEMDFDLLSHVGRAWQKDFELELKRRGIEVELVDDESGYYERAKEATRQ